MRAVLAAGVVALIVAAGVAYAVTRNGRKDGSEARGATAAGCAPVAGAGLVALSDDKRVARADNILPVIRRDGVVAAVVQQLDLVSTALDTRELAGLNRRIEADHAAPADVAQEFAAANRLTKKVDLRITYGLTIGTTGLPEQQVVAHLYRISLEAAGYRTTVSTLADHAALHAALTSGSVTLAPEYTGSYAAFLNDRARGEPNRFAAPEFVAQSLAYRGGELGLSFGLASPAAAQDVFAVSKAFADKYHVTSLDEFARACSGTATVLGGPAECPAGYPCRQSLADVYALRAGACTELPDRGPAARAALTGGTVSLALISSSDPAFA